MSPASSLATENAAPRRWLSIVGIGEDGVDGLAPVARRVISAADIVFGSKRHLELAGPLIRGAIRLWPSPFDTAMAEVMGQRGRQVCVLASGDPFFHGVGALLARQVDPGEMLVLPAPSAFSMAAARLGWALHDVILLSLHGRPLDLLRPHLHPGARILALTSNGDGPVQVASLLRELGFGPSRMTVLEALGGPQEQIRTARAAKFELGAINPLNVIGLEIEAERGARILSQAPGLADELFEHDGQITKREIRALTLSSLAPRRGELLWDIGAGAGSVAIEWLLADPSLRAIAIEQRPDRSERIARNAAALGVPNLEILAAAAPAALAGLEAPHAIFVGGGASDPGLFSASMQALQPGGRLVANAITLETEAALIAHHAANGGALTRIAVARAAPVGNRTGWRPAMPVTQWVWIKP